MENLKKVSTDERRALAAQKASATKQFRDAKAKTFEEGRYTLTKMYSFPDKILCARCDKPVSDYAAVLNANSMHSYQVCTTCACRLRGISKNDVTFAKGSLETAKDTRDKILKLKRLSCNYFNYFGVTVGGRYFIKLVVRHATKDFQGVLQFDEPTWDQYVFPMIRPLIA